MNTKLSDDLIAAAVNRAGSRPAAPDEMAADIRDAVEREWRKGVARRSRRSRRWLVAATVAAVGIGLALIGVSRFNAARPQVAGVFLASRGSVNIESPAGFGPPAGGKPFLVGTRLKTGTDGRALVAIADISLRFDRSTVAVFSSSDRLSIERGRVYLDIPANGGTHGKIEVVTPFGSIQHLGTQYQVQVDSREMTVSVREGRVRISTGQSEQTVIAHRSLVVFDDGSVRDAPLAPYAAAWNWTGELAPDFPIDGRSLAQCLEWFSHETGHGIVYATAAIRSRAEQTAMSGSISGLPPLESLDAMLATTSLAYRAGIDGSFEIFERYGAHDKLSPDATDPVHSAPHSSLHTQP